MASPTYSLDIVRATFSDFSRKVYAGRSPLYESLSSRVASDRELLTLASYGRKGTALPNLFFGAVHFLLLKGVQHQLASFYPSMSSMPGRVDLAFDSFRSFCLENSQEIRKIISTRLVQTNEVTRCACLVPVYGLVAKEAGEAPLAMVEIGASAGLNLFWDHYAYNYGEGLRCGNPFSKVQVDCELKGSRRPPLPENFPRIGLRTGLDLDPVDLDDPDSVLWLHALVWPEHRQRAKMLQSTIQFARDEHPKVLRGDALDLLPSVLETVPPEETLCIVHTLVTTFWTVDTRERLSKIISREAEKRPVSQVSLEWYKEWDLPRVRLATYNSGVENPATLAYCGSHGEWLEWLGAASRV